ncbi:submandibular glandular kallikrein-9-like, partial [Anopheles bellator]|uniref:submandibular glandular kallikrein-9-like n=1 Tax=Anopheles bellator TaxID=139047 RepID=UPI00264811CE
IKLLGGSSLKTSSYSFGVRSFGVHVAYNAATNANDIAFVEPSVSFDKVKGIIAAGRSLVEPPIGSNCFTLGWGWTDPVKRTLSDKLLLADYTIVSEASCTTIPGYTKTGMTLCGMPVVGKGTACNGDSGGPLVCIVGGKGLLHGIVSA